MPHSITLSQVSWSAPDGQSLFTCLDARFGAERTGLIGRNGVGKTTLLKLIAGELAPASGVVSTTGSIHVLRQSLQVTPGETIADLFGVQAELGVLARAYAGTATIEELSNIDWLLEEKVGRAMAAVGLERPLNTPLEELSGGQRTRAALAAQIYTAPDFIILDEPTNNLDRDGRKAVIDFLSGWRGGAVIVSHDRELLETVDAIVELTPLGATRYGGNWSHYRERKALELAAAEHDLADATKRLNEVRRKAQETAERKARSDGAGARKAAKGDMPRIVSGGLKMAAQQTSGANANRATRLKSDATDELQKARDRLEILQPISVNLPSTGLPAQKTVLKLERVTAGHSPQCPVISDLSLDITGPERVAIVGPNGSGKTTLLSVITGRLAPLEGSVHVGVRTAFLDQQVNLLDPGSSIRENFMKLNPQAGENECRAALARFMFRAEAALQPVGSLSGGQILRAGLACALGGPLPPQLLILDEPTNHLDLDAIAAVEAGLQTYDGALLVVSHDEAFLSNTGMTRKLELGPR